MSRTVQNCEVIYQVKPAEPSLQGGRGLGLKGLESMAACLEQEPGGRCLSSQKMQLPFACSAVVTIR
jgi:hypothetical protein